MRPLGSMAPGERIGRATPPADPGRPHNGGATDAQARAGHLESYWTSCTVPVLDDRYPPGEAYKLGLGLGLLNDEGSSGYPNDPAYPDGDSVLLIDLVEVNASLPDGYSSNPVNSLSDGDFQTFAPEAG